MAILAKGGVFSLSQTSKIEHGLGRIIELSRNDDRTRIGRKMAGSFCRIKNILNNLQTINSPSNLKTLKDHQQPSLYLVGYQTQIYAFLPRFQLLSLPKDLHHFQEQIHFSPR